MRSGARTSRRSFSPSFTISVRGRGRVVLHRGGTEPDIFCYVHMDLMPLGIRYLYDMDVMWGTRHNDWWLPEMALTSRASPRPRGALEVLRTSAQRAKPQAPSIHDDGTLGDLSVMALKFKSHHSPIFGLSKTTWSNTYIGPPFWRFHVGLQRKRMGSNSNGPIRRLRRNSSRMWEKTGPRVSGPATAAEAWPAAENNGKRGARRKTQRHETTSNPVNALAEENGCLQSRWTRRNAIEPRTYARCLRSLSGDAVAIGGKDRSTTRLAKRQAANTPRAHKLLETRARSMERAGRARKCNRTLWRESSKMPLHGTCFMDAGWSFIAIFAQQSPVAVFAAPIQADAINSAGGVA